MISQAKQNHYNFRPYLFLGGKLIEFSYKTFDKLLTFQPTTNGGTPSPEAPSNTFDIEAQQKAFQRFTSSLGMCTTS